MNKIRTQNNFLERVNLKPILPWVMFIFYQTFEVRNTNLNLSPLAWIMDYCEGEPHFLKLGSWASARERERESKLDLIGSCVGKREEEE